MVYDSYSPPFGVVMVCANVHKIIYVPQFENLKEYAESIKEDKCNVIVHMDKLGGEDRYLIQMPLFHFEDAYDLDDINDIILDDIMEFFTRTLRPCMTFVYKNEDY